MFKFKLIITAALSVPLFLEITPFEGDARKFKQWIKKKDETFGVCVRETGLHILRVKFRKKTV